MGYLLGAQPELEPKFRNILTLTGNGYSRGTLTIKSSTQWQCRIFVQHLHIALSLLHSLQNTSQIEWCLWPHEDDQFLYTHSVILTARKTWMNFHTFLVQHSVLYIRINCVCVWWICCVIYPKELIALHWFLQHGSFSLRITIAALCSQILYSWPPSQSIMATNHNSNHYRYTTKSFQTFYCSSCNQLDSVTDAGRWMDVNAGIYKRYKANKSKT